MEHLAGRYRRTLLGPLWVASSTIATGIGLAIVFGGIFGGDWRQTFPFILGSVTAWGLVAGTVMEGSTAFLAGAGLMQVKRLPMSFHAYLQMHKLVATFLHQLLAYWIVTAALGLFVMPHWLFVPAILLILLIGFFLSIPIGMIATRYRDVGAMIGMVMQALFLLTPVFWQRAQMPEQRRWIVDYNPFAHLLELVRQPLLGNPPPAYEWGLSLLLLLVAMLLAVVSLALHRRRVVFWL